MSLRFSNPLIVVICLISGGSLSADIVDDVAETRENLAEVVEIRKMLAAEKRAWRVQKSLMEGQLRLDQQALDVLETALAELRPQLEFLKAETENLTEDLAVSTGLVDFWTGKLETLKQRLSGLATRFPPGLKRELYGKFNDVLTLNYTEDTSQLKRVFDLSLEVISEVGEYHQSIHLETEVHRLDDGRRGEFNVVYLGLSGGYYYSENSGLAGMILWGGSGWNWVENNDMLADLVDLGAILSGQAAPRYQALPMPLIRGGAQ